MQVTMVPLSKITSTFNSRERSNETKDIALLMASIKKEGLLQPVGLIKDKDRYKLAFGNRRLQAFKKLGREEIPATILKDRKDGDLIITNLTENLNRLDTSFTEIGYAINTLMKKFKMTEQEVAVRLDMSRTVIRDYIHAYNYIPSEFRDKITNRGNRGKLPEKHIPLGAAVSVSACMRSKGLKKEHAKMVLNDVYNKTIKPIEVQGVLDKLVKGVEYKSAIKSTNGSLINVKISLLIDRVIYDNAVKNYGRKGFYNLLENKLKQTAKDLSSNGV